MQDEEFSYSTGALVGGEESVQSGGFFVDWVFNMFAGAIDIQLNSPILTVVYIGLLFALVFCAFIRSTPSSLSVAR